MKNKANLKYFLISLKNNIPFAIFNLILFSLVYTVPLFFILLENVEENMIGVAGYNGYYNLSTNNGFLIALLAIYAVVSPVICFRFLSKKKQIDTFYSLPISRVNLSIIKILTNILSVIVPFTLVYFTGSIMTFIFYPELQYLYYIILYFILIVMFVLYFMFNSFFFTRANRIEDGVLNILFANFALILMVASLNEIFDIDIFESDNIYFSLMPFMGFESYGNYFNDLIIAKYNYMDYAKGGYLAYQQWYSGIEWPGFSYIIVLLLLSATATTLFFVLHKKRKPELAEENSNSKFGLQVLTPIICSCLAIIFHSSGNLLTGVIVSSVIAILYLCVTVLELRSFRFPLYKIFILIGIVIISFL